MTSRTSRTFRSGRGRTVVAIVAGAGVLFALAACSTEQEGASSTSAAEDCANADAAQEQYTKAWSTTAEELGIEDLTPIPETVCEIDTASFAKDEPDGGYTIALAAQGPINSWGTLSEEAFKRHADEIGVNTLYASANGDATTQVDNIQQLASQKPDAMVVVPMGEGITGQVQAAAEQGIPVVLCSGILPDDSGAVSTVTRQYDLLGGAYAEWIAQSIGGKGKVAMLSGLAGVPTAEYQAAAAKKVFENYPDIDVVTQQYTEWSPTVAKTVADNLITQYPDLDAIWSDSGYGDLGVVQAYTAAGKTVPPLTGDSSNAFLKAVQGTDVQFALSTFPPEMSTDCLDTAVSVLKGEPVLNKIFIDSPSFTNANASEYVREDCGDNLFVPSTLDDATLQELGLCS
jgi:ribose transport system substrate-binding protein